MTDQQKITKQTPHLFDTHAHFSRADGNYTIEAQISRAVESGVSRIVAVGGSNELNLAAIDAAKLYPEIIRIALGFDRDNANELATSTAIQQAMDYIRAEIKNLESRKLKVCAIGEIGLDYHYSAESAEQQKILFTAQLELANELNLPVIIHSREADADTLALLKQHAESWQGNPERIGVLHCYTGGELFAAELVKLGYHISFSGIVTFLNADQLRKVARTIPSNRILIETDSPYLAPAPMRGNRNEPAFVKYVAACLAKQRNTTEEKIIQETSQNASDLFGWRSSSD